MSLSKVSKHFLQSIFGSRAADATVEWWKFNASGKAVGRQAARAVAAAPAADDAVYWSVGLMRAGTGRANANVESIHALVADDVGTKVSRDLVDMFMPAPDCVVESSPGNFQYVWAVPAGMTVIQHRTLWTGMEAVLGTRMDGSDQSHLFRLPEGVNGKPSKPQSGVALIRNNPQGYSYQQLAALLPSPGAPGLRQSGGGAKATKKDVLHNLTALPNDGVSAWCSDRKSWIDMGMAIKGALGDEGLDVWLDWCSQQPQGEDPVDVWEGLNPHSIGWGYIEILAKTHGAQGLAAAAFDDGDPGLAEALKDFDKRRRKTLGDFWAHAPSGKFIVAATGDMWPAVSVDAQVPGESYTDAAGKKRVRPASVVLRRDRTVDQLSWVPGRGQILEHTAVVEGGVVRLPGSRVFNLYKGPKAESGGSAQASLPWVAHVKKIFPDDAEHIFDWFAHRVQKPWEKINHALVLGGKQGVGKDATIQPLVHAVGSDNFSEVKPGQLLDRFNAYKKSVVLRVNEAHDLGEGQNRVKFYNAMKTLIAAPPETLQVEQKGIDIYSIPNVVGVIITTNYKVDGLYLPEDDRRHYVAWSNKTQSDLGDAYFAKLWKWMEQGGFLHVRRFLEERDISKFDPKAPPLKTRAFRAIAQAGKGLGDDEVEDVIEAMGTPDAFAWEDFLNKAPGAIHDLAKTNSRALAGKLDEAGYEKVLNTQNKDGRWRVGNRWVRVYAKREMAVGAQQDAAEKLTRDMAAKERKPF